MTIFTVGHSTLEADAFVALLARHAVRQLADVRTHPGSRRHPHFSGDCLSMRLVREGIVYRHFPDLGGRRRPRPDSTNTAWTEPGFRGYADHMATAVFEAALVELMAFAEAAPTAVMCAEARWWQCHRRLLADALLVRGLEVRHILGGAPAAPHELTPFARLVDARVIYPGLI